MNEYEPRLAKLVIPPWAWIDHLIEGTNTRVVHGIPPKTEFIRAWVDPETQLINLVVAHPNFTPCPEGNEIRPFQPLLVDNKPPALEQGIRTEIGMAMTTVRETLRRFLLMRREDLSGISGTGIVLVGVEFPDGKVAIQWQRKAEGQKDALPQTYASVNDMIAVHGHDGRAGIHWLDDAAVIAHCAVCGILEGIANEDCHCTCHPYDAPEPPEPVKAETPEELKQDAWLMSSTPENAPDEFPGAEVFEDQRPANYPVLEYEDLIGKHPQPVEVELPLPPIPDPPGEPREAPLDQRIKNFRDHMGREEE